jgi:hypothetical protein
MINARLRPARQTRVTGRGPASSRVSSAVISPRRDHRCGSR